MSLKTTPKALFFIALSHWVSIASAQDYSEEANYGDIQLEGFFAADPVEILPGGSRNISHIENCVGYVSNAPDLKVNVIDPVLPLNFYAVSNTDTVLLINDPNGNWHCNDDFGSGSGVNPGIEFPDPEAGVYDVWVGTYSEDGDSDDASLHILSFSTPWSDDFDSYDSTSANSADRLDFTLDAFNTANLDSSFTPDPYTIDIAAGGTINADYMDNCTGYASTAPDLELEYSDAGIFSLSFFVTGSIDTTLIVNDPSGNWHCNDDFSIAGGTNPGIVFENPQSGTYDVWVGTYSEDDAYDNVELMVTELGAPWSDDISGNESGIDISLPTPNTASLSGSFAPDPYSIYIPAGGSVQASDIDSDCTGWIASGPDFELNFSSPSSFDLGFFVESDSDTTLLVNDPNGNWHCNDDYGVGGGTNPGVVFANPGAGTYHVWVGTYAEDSGIVDSDLYVSELGAPWSSNGNSETIPSPNPPGTGGSGSPVGSGTGFLVSETGHILTNHHVIEGCSRQTFQIRGEVAIEASLLSSNAATDLALLKAEIASEPATFRGTDPVRLGEEVVVYGFPLLGDLSSQGNLTNGIVSALSGLNDDLSRMQMTAQIQPGNSGGPVMNRNGDIVGVVVETANTEFFEQQRGTSVQNLNFAIRDSLALSFLDTNNVDYQRQSGETIERPIVDIAEQAQNFTGIILCYR